MGAWTVIGSVGEPGSEGSVITTYVPRHLPCLGDMGDLGDVALSLDSTGRVRLSDIGRALGGSLVLGSVCAFTPSGGLTLSPGLWLNTSPAGMDTGLGGTGGGAACLAARVGLETGAETDICGVLAGLGRVVGGGGGGGGVSEIAISTLSDREALLTPLGLGETGGPDATTGTVATTVGTGCVSVVEVRGAAGVEGKGDTLATTGPAATCLSPTTGVSWVAWQGRPVGMFSSLGIMMTVGPCLDEGCMLRGISTTTDCIGLPEGIIPIAEVVIMVGETCCIALMDEGSVVVCGSDTDVDRGGGGGGTFFLMTVVDDGGTLAGIITGDGDGMATGTGFISGIWTITGEGDGVEIRAATGAIVGAAEMPLGVEPCTGTVI